LEEFEESLPSFQYQRLHLRGQLPDHHQQRIDPGVLVRLRSLPDSQQREQLLTAPPAQAPMNSNTITSDRPNSDTSGVLHHMINKNLNSYRTWTPARRLMDARRSRD
jgi:hypothetical protein